MDSLRSISAALITGLVVACLVLAAALPITSAFGRTLEAGDRPAMTIDINVPLNQIQDGQFCQAYALVYNGTPPYTFTWGGQFTNGDASAGPQGANQIVSGFVDAGRGDLTLHVTDSAMQEDFVTASLQIDASYSYNAACEA
jgi:hypothetical protein